MKKFSNIIWSTIFLKYRKYLIKLLLFSPKSFFFFKKFSNIIFPFLQQTLTIEYTVLLQSPDPSRGDWIYNDDSFLAPLCPDKSIPTLQTPW